MWWNGVVDLCLDALGKKILLQSITFLAKDREDVEYAVTLTVMKLNVGIADVCIIVFCNFFATTVSFVKQGKEATEYGCLHLVDAAITSYIVTYITLAVTIVGYAANDGGKLVVIGCDTSSITQRSEIFSWVETVTGSITQAPRLTTVVQATVSLCVIFDKKEVVRLA